MLKIRTGSKDYLRFRLRLTELFKDKTAMYQKDYILRMIEMMADLIAAILRLISKGDYPLATRAIENVFHDFLKQDAAFFNRIPKEDLTGTLLSKHNFTNGHLQILAELFYAQAELSSALGKSAESAPFYEKSLILLDFIDKDSKIFSVERQERISLIRHRLGLSDH
jgi:hypothetical protein